MAISGLSLTCIVSAAFLCHVASGCFVMRMRSNCPEPKVQDNFDVNRYIGRWFEYARFPNTIQVGTRCVIANYTLQEDNKIKVFNTAIQEYSLGLGLCPWYKSVTAIGEGSISNANVSAKLSVQFNPNAPKGKYWVLETDYDNYSIVYSCEKRYQYLPVIIENIWVLTREKAKALQSFGVDNEKPINAWVLTREKAMAPTGLDAIYERLRKQDIDPSYFTVSEQEHCPEWPARD